MLVPYIHQKLQVFQFSVAVADRKYITAYLINYF